jgi:uncharacterized protein
MSQENMETMRRIIDLANAQDVDGVLEFIAADIEAHPASDQPEVGVLRGRQAYADYVRPWYEEVFEEYLIEVDEFIDSGDYVVVVGRVRARGRISGLRVGDDEVWLWRFRDGKAVEYRECTTKAHALEAAGLRE